MPRIAYRARHPRRQTTGDAVMVSHRHQIETPWEEHSAGGSKKNLAPPKVVAYFLAFLIIPFRLLYYSFCFLFILTFSTQNFALHQTTLLNHLCLRSPAFLI